MHEIGSCTERFKLNVIGMIRNVDLCHLPNLLNSSHYMSIHFKSLARLPTLQTLGARAVKMSTTAHIYGSSLPPQPPATTPSDPNFDAAQPTSSAPSVKMTSHNQYHSPRLLPSHLNPNPLLQFQEWFQSALSPPTSSSSSTGEIIPPVREPEAMSLSTVSPSGIPSSRMVLLKTVDATGFLFYTNYTSRKSSELSNTGYASLVFYWKEVSRQVRVIGRVEKVDRQESEGYFKGRPRGSQLGAWASRQSTVVGEGDLEGRLKSLEERFKGDGGEIAGEVPCPEFWGGWRVVPL
jgi:pyridoxamine 5'-phosphate oxidase